MKAEPAAMAENYLAGGGHEGFITSMDVPSAEHLKAAIIQSLCKQGYRAQGGTIQLPDNPTKDDFRALNELALQQKLEVSGPGVRPYEDRLYHAAGLPV